MHKPINQCITLAISLSCVQRSCLNPILCRFCSCSKRSIYGAFARRFVFVSSRCSSSGADLWNEKLPTTWEQKHYDTIKSPLPDILPDVLNPMDCCFACQGHPPLALTLTGSCVPQPADSVHLLSFRSRARVPTAQSVTIENPTDKNWFIAPVLKGDHWQGAGQLQVRVNDDNRTRVNTVSC